MKSFSILLLAAVLPAASLTAVAQTSDTTKKEEPPTGVFVRNVDAHQAAKLLQENKKIIVLDVRTADEFAAGHIAGATNLDFHDAGFEKKLAALDKKKSYLVHCAAGGRSAKSRDLMKKLQFESIYHLDGGLKAWEKAGKPIER